MRPIIIATLVASSLHGACSRAPDASKPPAATTSAKDAAVNPLDALLIGPEESLFLAQVKPAQAVFVGTLVEVGPPPAAFSGYAVSTQALTFEVGRVLRGDVPGPRITVHHVIVGSSPALTPGTTALAPAHTAVGSEYIVAVGGTMEGKRVTANENVAPIKATPELIAKVEAALK